MIRFEFVLVGCVLVTVGLGLIVIGHQKTQPTAVDTVVNVLENLSGQRVRGNLESDKSSGYLLITVGVVGLVAGLGFILASRTSSGDPIDRD